MAEEFKPITTQEEFNAAIKARLERQESTIRKEYADYEDLKAQGAKFEEEKQAYEKQAQASAEKIASLKKELDESKATVKGLQIKELKSSIAAELGLPAALRDRIAGETEEEIRKDAQILSEVFAEKNRQNLPGFNPERAPGDDKEIAWKQVLEGLKKD